MKVNANRNICDQAALHRTRLGLDLQEIKFKKCETYRIPGALRALHLMKIYPAFCENIKFIAVLTKAHHWI